MSPYLQFTLMFSWFWFFEVMNKSEWMLSVVPLASWSPCYCGQGTFYLFNFTLHFLLLLIATKAKVFTYCTFLVSYMLSCQMPWNYTCYCLLSIKSSSCRPLSKCGFLWKWIIKCNCDKANVGSVGLYLFILLLTCYFLIFNLQIESFNNQCP